MLGLKLGFGVASALFGPPQTLALGPKALDGGGPWPLGQAAGKSVKSPKLSNQPGWTLASLLVQESSHQGPGGLREGAGQTPEAKGYDLGLYFSYAKGGLGACHPLAEY